MSRDTSNSNTKYISRRSSSRKVAPELAIKLLMGAGVGILLALLVSVKAFTGLRANLLSTQAELERIELEQELTALLGPVTEIITQTPNLSSSTRPAMDLYNLTLQSAANITQAVFSASLHNGKVQIDEVVPSQQSSVVERLNLGTTDLPENGMTRVLVGKSATSDFSRLLFFKNIPNAFGSSYVGIVVELRDPRFPPIELISVSGSEDLNRNQNVSVDPEESPLTSIIIPVMGSVIHAVSKTPPAYVKSSYFLLGLELFLLASVLGSISAAILLWKRKSSDESRIYKLVHVRNEQLRILMEAIPTTAFMCSKEGEIVFSSNSFSDFLKQTPDKLFQKNWLQLLQNKDKARMSQALEDNSSSPESFAMEVHFNDLDQPQMLRMTPIQSQNALVGYIVVIANTPSEAAHLAVDHSTHTPMPASAISSLQEAILQAVSSIKDHQESSDATNARVTIQLKNEISEILRLHQNISQSVDHLLNSKQQIHDGLRENFARLAEEQNKTLSAIQSKIEEPSSSEHLETLDEIRRELQRISEKEKEDPTERLAETLDSTSKNIEAIERTLKASKASLQRLEQLETLHQEEHSQLRNLIEISQQPKTANLAQHLEEALLKTAKGIDYLDQNLKSTKGTLERIATEHSNEHNSIKETLERSAQPKIATLSPHIEAAILDSHRSFEALDHNFRSNKIALEKLTAEWQNSFSDLNKTLSILQQTKPDLITPQLEKLKAQNTAIHSELAQLETIINSNSSNKLGFEDSREYQDLAKSLRDLTQLASSHSEQHSKTIELLQAPQKVAMLDPVVSQLLIKTAKGVASLENNWDSTFSLLEALDTRSLENATEVASIHSTLLGMQDQKPVQLSPELEQTLLNTHNNIGEVAQSLNATKFLLQQIKLINQEQSADQKELRSIFSLSQQQRVVSLAPQLEESLLNAPKEIESLKLALKSTEQTIAKLANEQKVEHKKLSELIENIPTPTDSPITPKFEESLSQTTRGIQTLEAGLHATRGTLVKLEQLSREHLNEYTQIYAALQNAQQVRPTPLTPQLEEALFHTAQGVDSLQASLQSARNVLQRLSNEQTEQYTDIVQSLKALLEPRAVALEPQVSETISHAAKGISALIEGLKSTNTSIRRIEQLEIKHSEEHNEIKENLKTPVAPKFAAIHPGLEQTLVRTSECVESIVEGLKSATSSLGRLEKRGAQHSEDHIELKEKFDAAQKSTVYMMVPQSGGIVPETSKSSKAEVKPQRHTTISTLDE